MSKMRKWIKRFICYILVIAIIIPLIPTPHVSVEINEMVEDIYAEQKDSKEDALSDIMSPYSKNDWNTVRHKDHLPWNYFHNKVQRDVRKKNSYIEDKEL